MNKIYKTYFFVAAIVVFSAYSMDNSRVHTLQNLAADKIFDSTKDFESFLKSQKLPEGQIECFNYGSPRDYFISKLWLYSDDKISNSKKEYNNDNIISAIKFSANSEDVFFGDHAGNFSSFNLDKNQFAPLSNINSMHSDLIKNIVVSDDEKYIFTVSEEGTLKIWDSNRNCINSISFDLKDETVSHVAFNYSNNLIALGFSNGKVILSNFSGIYSEQFSYDSAVKAIFFDDNNQYWVCYSDGKIYCINLETQNLDSFCDEVYSKFNPKNCCYDYKNGKIYIAVDTLKFKALFCFDINKKEFSEIVKLNLLDGAISSIDVSPDNRYAILGFNGGGIEIYSLLLREKVWSSDLFFSFTGDVAFSPDGKKFAFAVDADLFVYSMPEFIFKDNIVYFSHLQETVKNLKDKASNKYYGCQII